MSITRREALQRTAGAGVGASAVVGLGVLAGAKLSSSGSAARATTITCLGDSLSDVAMYGSGAYPYWLRRFLVPIAVSADGVAGNDTKAVLARCRPDGIHTRSRVQKPGSVSFVLAGTIDILYLHAGAPELTRNLARIYAYLQRHGSTVYPVTIPPWAGSSWFSSEREAVRVAVNSWILRRPHAVDTDLTMGNGAHPPKLRPEFDWGDGVHPARVLGAQMLALICAVALVPR